MLELRGFSTANTYSESKEISKSEKEFIHTKQTERLQEWESISSVETQTINTIPGKKTLETIMEMAGRLWKTQRHRCCSCFENQVTIFVEIGEDESRGWEEGQKLELQEERCFHNHC